MQNNCRLYEEIIIRLSDVASLHAYNFLFQYLENRKKTVKILFPQSKILKRSKI